MPVHHALLSLRKTLPGLADRRGGGKLQERGRDQNWRRAIQIQYEPFTACFLIIAVTIIILYAIRSTCSLLLNCVPHCNFRDF